MQFFSIIIIITVPASTAVFFIVRVVHEINFCSLQPVAFFIRPSTLTYAYNASVSSRSCFDGFFLLFAPTDDDRSESTGYGILDRIQHANGGIGFGE